MNSDEPAGTGPLNLPHTPRVISESTFTIVDLETTGLSAKSSRITEVACVVVRSGAIIAENATLVNPGQFIPQAIQQMTGITNAMVAVAPKEDEIFPIVREWIDPHSIFTAHNAHFDHSFLQESFGRHAIPLLADKTLCTVRLARRLMPYHKGFSLAKVTASLGIRIKDRHRALGDARATAQLLLHLLAVARDECGIESIDELLKLQNRPIGRLHPVAPRLQSLSESVRSFPSAPGIYKMIGRGEALLYVGKAKNLRERVGSYFRAGADHLPKIRELVTKVKRVEYEPTGSELAAILLEAKLIHEHQPKYNTAGKRLRRYGFLRLDLTSPFPTLDIAAEVVPDGAEYYGPFRNRDEAELLQETLGKLLPIRKCSDEAFHQHRAAPCLYHQMGWCGGMCAGLMSAEEYRAVITSVRELLRGGEEGVIGRLRERMDAHARDLEFEDAGFFRDRIRELQRIFVWKRDFAESINTNNLMILLPSAVAGSLDLFMIRFGQLAHRLQINSRFPERTLLSQIDSVFMRQSGRAPHLSRIDVDEIRRVAAYLRSRVSEGEIIRVEEGIAADELVRGVRDVLERQRPSRLRRADKASEA